MLQLHHPILHPNHLGAGTDLHPQGLQLPRRVGRQILRERFQPALTGLDQNDLGGHLPQLMVLRQRLPAQFSDRAGHLYTSRPSADQHEGQQTIAFGTVPFDAGAFERQQNPAPQIQCIVQRLQTWRERPPLVMAEIARL